MNFRLIILLVLLPTLFMYGSCNKTSYEDPHNHSLINKSLAEIRSEISGDWYVVLNTVCGFTGCQSVSIPTDLAPVWSFLTNDTLRQTAHSRTPIYYYEKADSIVKKYDGYSSQQAWTFYFPSQGIVFQKIQNDTLIAYNGYGQVSLIKKR